MVTLENIAVLVIDDEASVADALGLILGDYGFQVTIATSGSKGLEYANQKSFDVVITDLRLPDISGLEVLKEIRKHDPSMPVIIITAHCTPDVIEESNRLGVLEVLSKPFFPSDVLTLISKALSQRQLNSESQNPRRKLRDIL